MPAAPRNKNLKLFLDSSIIVSAAISATGGAFRIFQEANQNRLRLFTNHYVSNEVEQVLERKYPTKLLELPYLLIFGKCRIVKNPPANFIQTYLGLIDDKDLPILAGALKAQADYLLTHDQKDFLTRKLRNANLPVVIATPKQFFQEYFI